MNVQVNVTALVVPRSLDLRAFSRSWFPESGWLREPLAPRPAQALVGARFRGAPASDEHGALGLLELGGDAHVVGPFPATRDDEVAWWVTEVTEVAEDGGAGAVGRAWATAVAAHVDGATAVPDPATAGALVAAVEHACALPGAGPDAGVREAADRAWTEVRAAGLRRAESVRGGWRTLYSPMLVDVQQAFDLLVRHGLRTSLEGAPERHRGLVGTLGYTLVGRTAFDGAVVLRMYRADLEPPALRELPWRDHGPFAYELTWRAEHEGGDAGGAIDEIARRRVLPGLVRISHALRDACTGTILTGDGFLAA